MKTKAFVTTVLALVMFFSVDAFGQRGRRAPDVRPQHRSDLQVSERAVRQSGMMTEACQMLPDLTEEQQAQIRSLKVKQLETATQHQNQVNELRAKKRTLMTQPTPDQRELDRVIDQMTSMQNTRMKEAVQHRQAVRELLTEEQRVIYDSRTTRQMAGRAAIQGRQPANMQGRQPATRGATRQQGRGRW